MSDLYAKCDPSLLPLMTPAGKTARPIAELRCLAKTHGLVIKAGKPQAPAPKREVAGATRAAKKAAAKPAKTTKAKAKAIVFVQCEEGASFTALKKQDIKVNETKGEVRTAYLPLDRM